MRFTRRLHVVIAALALALVAVTAASAATFLYDRQANFPQVSNVPGSDTSAVFPTNKQNEPTIAVNPVDSNIVLAGSNDEQRQPPCGPGTVRGTDAAPNDCSFFPGVGTSGIYRSMDAGMTWHNLGLLDDQPTWHASALVSDGDPVIVFGPKPDSNGVFSYADGARAYYATLASYKPGQSPYPPMKAPELIAVSWSDNNGTTWSAPVVVVTKSNPNNFNDKEAMWVDRIPTSPYFGRAYVTWTQFRSAVCCPSEPVAVSVSADGGASWSAPKQVSPAGNNGTGNGRQGSAVRSGPDGTVYVAWEQGPAQVLSTSRDGGMTWSRPAKIAPVADISDPIPGANFRTDSFLSLAADPRAGSTTVYASWVNRTAGVGRVVVATSTNRGRTWDVHEVSTVDEGYAFFQGLDVAADGRVDVGYQALKTVNPDTFGTGNAWIDSWYVGKSPAGLWSPPMKISTHSSDPAVSAQNNLARQFWGDYNTLASSTNAAFFIYTDSRTGVGCPAVDDYQKFVAGTSADREDWDDIMAARTGKNPYVNDPSVKPAPSTDCPSSQFGNTDVYVSKVSMP